MKCSCDSKSVATVHRNQGNVRKFYKSEKIREISWNSAKCIVNQGISEISMNWLRFSWFRSQVFAPVADFTPIWSAFTPVLFLSIKFYRKPVEFFNAFSHFFCRKLMFWLPNPNQGIFSLRSCSPKRINFRIKCFK